MNLKNILITEDEPHMQRLIDFTLRKTRQNILLAGNGEDALRLAQGTPIHLLVVDVGLPGMSGPETVEAIKALPGHESLPVIMLTARGESNIKREAERLGVRAFLTKPFSPTELARLAQDILAV